MSRNLSTRARTSFAAFAFGNKRNYRGHTLNSNFFIPYIRVINIYLRDKLQKRPHLFDEIRHFDSLPFFTKLFSKFEDVLG